MRWTAALWSLSLMPLAVGMGLVGAHGREPSGGGTETARVERRLGSMGTMLELAVEAADRERALAASERAVAVLEAAEARLSTWRGDTELAALNRAPVGEPFALSPALGADLAAAARCSAETGGAFDPTVGPLVAAWGLRTGGRLPGEGELRAALAATGMSGLRLLFGSAGTAVAAVRAGPGLVLEEGAFGKGAGLGDAIAALRAAGIGRAVLDLGGQVAVLGGGWSVAVADPRRRERPVAALAIDGGSVSTSGNGERGSVVDGRRIGHLLDPRTGRPARDFGSLTVWTADPLTADCLSTGLFVMGPEAALAWATRHPGIEVLALEPKKGNRLAARATPGLARRLSPLVADLDVAVVGGKEEDER